MVQPHRLHRLKAGPGLLFAICRHIVSAHVIPAADEMVAALNSSNSSSASAVNSVSSRKKNDNAGAGDQSTRIYSTDWNRSAETMQKSMSECDPTNAALSFPFLMGQG